MNLKETLTLGVDFAQFISTAMLAYWGIVISERQVSGTTKVKLKTKKRFVPGNDLEEKKVNIEVDIINLGLAPIYIEELGIAIHRRFKRSTKKFILFGNSDELKLESGKPYTKSFIYSQIHSKIRDIIPECDYNKMKVSIYVKYHLEEIYYSKKENLLFMIVHMQRLKKACLIQTMK